MSAAEILNQRMSSYLDKWYSLGDASEYSRPIIDCLKAIYTRSRLERKNVTMYKGLYQKYSYHD